MLTVLAVRLRFDTQFSTELHYFEEVLMLVGCRFRLSNYTEFELKRQSVPNGRSSGQQGGATSVISTKNKLLNCKGLHFTKPYG